MLNTEVQSWSSNKLLGSWKSFSPSIQAEIERNIQAACQAMLETAREETPPKQGEVRGRNMVTGKMAESWQCSYTIEEDGTLNVSLYNEMPYAKFVDQGHNVKKHFVPWLYVDDMGYMSRHIPIAGEKLFGLVVGTKTSYKEPENITQKAMVRFYEVFDALCAETLNISVPEKIDP